MVVRPNLEPSLRASLTSLRGWLVGPTVSADEAAAFAEYTRELTTRLWPGLGLVLGVAALAWWPIDRLVYPESAVSRDAFADFRLRIFVLDVGFALALPRIALAQRHAHAAAPGQPARSSRRRSNSSIASSHSASSSDWRPDMGNHRSDRDVMMFLIVFS